MVCQRFSVVSTVFMGITNIGSQGEITPVPVTDDERRFILFYSSLRLKGNTALWDEVYSLIDDWSAIRSILQYMLTFQHGPMFADTEIPKTEFQKSAVTTHPILQFVKDYVNETQFDGIKLLFSFPLFSGLLILCSVPHPERPHLIVMWVGVRIVRAKPGTLLAATILCATNGYTCVSRGLRVILYWCVGLG